jgi:GWxTD domain-containing protein
MQKRILLFFALSLFLSSMAFSQRQRVDYIDLINRASIPQIFFDNIILPTEEGKAEMGIIFRFNNDFLPYKKITVNSELEAPEGSEYYTIVRLNKEVFKGRADRGRRNSDQVEVASRDMWIDTLYTTTFEDTESNKLYASGSLLTELEPGEYNNVLQLSLIENTNDHNSNQRNFRIPDWETKPNGEIYLLKSGDLDRTKYELTNIGNNIFFGEDFQTLIRIPDYSEESEYTVSVYKMNAGRRDTTKGESVFEYTLTTDEIITGKRPILTKGEDPSLSMVDSELGFTYSLLTIPHSTFQNAAYRLEVTSADGDQPIATKFFRSYWPDMPASLLNLDIAIDHLKFILNEDQVKEIKDGSSTEKEQKFREFWERRDPSRGTVYNELMAEYYRRIDYAFLEFSNRGNFAGHESDQGKVYINYGPADSIDRQFPTNGKVVEIWKYGDKSFVFEASTGFGDFVLIGTE